MEYHTNIGRCSRCDFSEMRDLHRDSRKHRYCLYYSYVCQPVARNCKAPYNGYKKNQKDILKEK